MRISVTERVVVTTCTPLDALQTACAVGQITGISGSSQEFQKSNAGQKPSRFIVPPGLASGSDGKKAGAQGLGTGSDFAFKTRQSCSTCSRAAVDTRLRPLFYLQ